MKAVSSIVAPGHRWSMPDLAVISFPVMFLPCGDTLKKMFATSGAMSNIIKLIVRSRRGREDKEGSVRNIMRKKNGRVDRGRGDDR